MIARAALALALALGAAPVLAQTAPAPLPSPSAAPTPTIDHSLPHVALDTAAGRIVLELETAKAPITAANFLRYVDQRRLDGIVFYRVVKAGEHFGFVQLGVDGDPKRILPPIKHEPTSETGLKHVDGTISLARLEPGSGRGEFTISVGDQFSLDADPSRPDDATHTNLGYATFGRVVAGMDVVMTIFNAPVSPTANIRGAFTGEVPVAAVKVISARRIAY